MALVGLVLVGCGATFSQRGSIATDARAYLRSPKYSGQEQGTSVSLAFEPELSLQTDDQKHTATLRPFIRMDAVDSQRTHYDLRQADYVFATDGWELGAGIGTFSFGVLEGNRLVDVTNQVDFVEDWTRRTKLGQPYAKIGATLGPVTLQAFYLAYNRAETFPGVRGRLRPAVVIDTDEPMYESELGAWHPSAALRASFHTDEWDIAVSGYSGLSREPTLLARFNDAHVTPRYDFLQQGGFDAQWTHGALILRAEGVTRWWSADYRFSWAAAGGIEYTFFDLGGMDLTWLAEYYLDRRPVDTPYSLLQNDAFAGARLAINDEGNTEFRAGAVTDLETGTVFLSAQAKRSFWDHWSVQLEGMAFFARGSGVDRSFEHDHYLQLRLEYFL